MHGETLKFVNAQQVKPYNIYENTKLKLLKTNAAIWFNKICRDRQLQPRYINIKLFKLFCNFNEVQTYSLMMIC